VQLSLIFATCSGVTLGMVELGVFTAHLALATNALGDHSYDAAARARLARALADNSSYNAVETVRLNRLARARVKRRQPCARSSVGLL